MHPIGSHILDRVFATWSHVALLRTLARSPGPLTGRQAARASGMTHRTCGIASRRLVELGMVNKGGRHGRQEFTLNRDHLLLRNGILPLFALEQEHVTLVARALRKELSSIVESVILYGSSLRLRDHPQPGLEVCIVVSDIDAHRVASGVVEECRPMLRRQFGTEIVAWIVTQTEFTRRARKGIAPAAAILKEGIVICGKRLKEIGLHPPDARGSGHRTPGHGARTF